ncbi:hypothetical protein B0H66DRAFT_532168 [Apodospora peruviana]|uniref:Uncharacterized protein n=1 Tax=Apodospora peruviana TaxID=516989 RepID=A0AAE0IDA3_9PEZI|nr:hypothetical protein B0H66DRAFT_532168 [Apodospora peruviana]
MIRNANWVAALAGARKFSGETDWLPATASEPDHASSPGWEHPESKTADNTTTRNDETNIPPTVFESSHPLLDDDNTNKQEEEEEKQKEVTRAITLCIAARTSFAATVFIPIVLMLAVTAAIFYDALSKKGDKMQAVEGGGIIIRHIVSKPPGSARCLQGHGLFAVKGGV